MPKISIIVPVYNAEKYLQRCLDSMICQTLEDLEIILIDDGSSDGSPEICETYAKLDCRFKVIHKENAGICAARNDGLDIAAGKYITFADNDDFCLPNMYETLFRYAESHGKNDIIKCGAYLIPENELPESLPRSEEEAFELIQILESEGRMAFHYSEQSFPAEFLYKYMHLNLLDCAVWNILFPAHIAKSVKFDLFPGEDFKYVCDISERMENGFIHLIDPMLYIYNLRQNSTTMSVSKSKTIEMIYMEDCERNINIFHKFIKKGFIEDAGYFYNWSVKVYNGINNYCKPEKIQAYKDRIHLIEDFIENNKKYYDPSNFAWREANFKVAYTAKLHHPCGAEARGFIN